ncbi:15964_t:CDS:2, partial [Racocetra fulgida]
VDINDELYNDKYISNDTDNNQLGHLPLIRIELYCGKTFETCEEYQETLEHYAYQNNFMIRKKRVDNSCDLCQRTWDCEQSDKYGPDNKTIIKLTSMHLEHNIILNDNTAATNTYNLPLSIFAIVDNNFRSWIIAQAILPDETSERVQPGNFMIDTDLGLEIMYYYKKVDLEDLDNLTLEVSEKGYFHISLIPKCWYKDEFADAMINDEPFVREKSLEDNSSTFTMLIEPPVQTTAKAIGCKQSIKGLLLELAHKCVELVNYDDLNDSDILMEIFKEWMHTHEEGQCNKQTIEQNNQVIESDQDTETTRLDIQNPLKHIGKGCPPKRQIKSAIEQSKKSKHPADTSSHASHQCSICKSKEHDKRNCPNK